jgi:methyltransferase
MNDVFPFIAFFIVIVLQRLIELLIAKSNEKLMKQQGAIEFGTMHYRFMVLIHMLFFSAFIVEKLSLNRGLSQLWILLLLTFLGAQVIRIWAITSLGKYWNTKIIVLPNSAVVRRGPYRYIKHPNYFVVAIELIVIPLLFEAYYTACLFTILNGLILSIRIREEEKALNKLTEYEGTFQNCNRFLPRLLNKSDR